jgi:hypothetical protein
MYITCGTLKDKKQGAKEREREREGEEEKKEKKSILYTG